jgi:hypothetical protein
MTDLYIDGDIFVVDDGSILRFVGGKSEGWQIEAPGDTILRATPQYRSIASASDKRVGLIYAWDTTSGRVVALDKAKGTFVEQYRLTGGNPGWSDVRGMYVVVGAEQGAPATLVWATKDDVFSAILERASDGPSASPSGSGGPAGSSGAAPSGGASGGPAASAPAAP